MQQTRNRGQGYRAKPHEAGFKSVQIWVPDPSAPGFTAECFRQSALAARDDKNLDDLEDLGAVPDFEDHMM